jgi:uncharacterized lipoprotein
MRKLILATCLLTLLAGCDSGTSTTQGSSQSSTHQLGSPAPMAGGGGY